MYLSKPAKSMSDSEQPQPRAALVVGADTAELRNSLNSNFQTRTYAVPNNHPGDSCLSQQPLSQNLYCSTALDAQWPQAASGLARM
jgi:hypothetical protein